MVWFKKDLFTRREDKTIKVPQGLWVKCEHCNEIIYKKEVERNLDVCPKCDYHFRISAAARIAITFDENTFVEFDSKMEPVDALDFRDLKKYKDRLKSAQKETGLRDAMISGEGLIGGQKTAAAVFEFSYMGGSMGSVVGEKITRVIERAIEARAGAGIFLSSRGAR